MHYKSVLTATCYRWISWLTDQMFRCSVWARGHVLHLLGIVGSAHFCLCGHLLNIWCWEGQNGIMNVPRLSSAISVRTVRHSRTIGLRSQMSLQIFVMTLAFTMIRVKEHLPKSSILSRYRQAAGGVSALLLPVYQPVRVGFSPAAVSCHRRWEECWPWTRTGPWTFYWTGRAEFSFWNKEI